MGRTWIVGLALASSLALFGCPPKVVGPDGGGSPPDTASFPSVDGAADSGGPVGTGASVSRMIGPDGGILVLEAASLTVPPGALALDEPITITSLPTPPPSQYQALSPLYDFKPDGLTFAIPATLAISFVGDPAAAGLFSSQAFAADDFEELDDQVSGQTVSAPIAHFSDKGVFVKCAKGSFLCGSKCVDPQTNANACGVACAKACQTGPGCTCGAGQACSKGVCQSCATLGDNVRCRASGNGPGLPDGLCCHGSCVPWSSFASDTMNCGGCGVLCPLGNACLFGSCYAPLSGCTGPNCNPGCQGGCPTGQVCCGVVCRDAQQFTRCPDGSCVLGGGPGIFCCLVPPCIRGDIIRPTPSWLGCGSSFACCETSPGDPCSVGCALPTACQ